MSAAAFGAMLRERGVVETSRAVVNRTVDAWFDLRHGVDTVGLLPVDGLGLEGPHQASAVHYEPTGRREVQAILRRVDPRGGTFVDYGCGKGRCLLVAAEARFARVVGVELSPHLVEIARRNAARYRRVGLVPIEVVNADAAAHVLDDDETVFFFYNPFDAAVLDPVLDEIERSLTRMPRPVQVVYVNPVHAEAVDARSFLSRTGELRLPRAEVIIYASR